ncbi:hypothetical protein HJC23_002432 [Cyclotella cryptica]|uniref:Conserved oligomeric Golgi complex subunit 3 C-terminal domain-containing protein n=1 Tax=Cyclotella cryptica TaxID=29204 RepID=A0ABD3PVL3_9STRA|eukprot:CCRYP_011136-RA/>CCRYP_011136-RA protein AED:0.18 eAED:0.18 QI:0/0.33/0.25/1/0.33/0.25/4/904/939
MSSSSSLPPPPKLSGLVTPSSSANSASSRLRTAYATPSSSSNLASRYQTLLPSLDEPATLNGSCSSTQAAPSYETFAPRSAEQRARLARLAALTAGPYFAPPQESKEDPDDERLSLAAALCPPKQSGVDTLNDDALHHSLSSFPADPAISQTLQQTILATNNLANLIKHTASLKLALRASLNIANDVSKRHADLLRHSGELSAAAERLQHEEQILTRRAEEIGMPLQHYDAVDRIGPLVGVLFKEGGRVTVRGIAKLHVDDERFVDILREIDQAIEFFGEAGGGAAVYGRPPSSSSSSREGRFRGRYDRQFDPAASGSVEYYRRACVLQDAALELLRVGVADRIVQTSEQVRDALNIPRVPVGADKLEASLAYTRFHGISRRSNALITIVRRRLEALGSGSLASPLYEELLTLCRNTYCGARESLLTMSVRHHMDILKERHGLVGMTRLASVFLIRLCTVETALYLDFFGDPQRGIIRGRQPKDGEEEEGGGKAPDGQNEDKNNSSRGAANDLKRTSSTSSHPAAATLASQILSEDATYRDAEFQSMLGGLCSALHRTIRRGLVSVLDLDVLCQVVSVLREERSAANSSAVTLAAARAVSGVIQDAQERLIFCANSAMHKEVVRFKPTAADLNYPGKLLGEKPKPAIIIDDEDDRNKNDGSTGESQEQTPAAAVDSSGEGKAASAVDVTDAVSAQLRVYESWFPPMRSVLRILSKIFRVVEPRVFEDIALQSVQACTKSLKDASAHILSKSGQIHADLFLVKHLLILREQLSPFDIQLRSVERQLDFSEAGKAVSRFLANRNRRLFSMSTENALITLLREGVSVQESSVDSKRDLEDCLRSACNDFIEHTSTSLLGPISGLVDQCKNAVGTGTGSTEALVKASFMNGVVVKGIFSKAVTSLDAELENVSKQMNLYLENTATQSILLKPVVRKTTRRWKK